LLEYIHNIMSNFQVQKGNLVQELYTSRKNILNYLKKQNYDTSSYDDFSIAEIVAMNNSIKQNDSFTGLDFTVHNSEKKCSVFYYLKPSTIKQNTLENMVMEYFEENENKSNAIMILIMQGNVNDTVKKTVQTLWKRYNEQVIVFEMKTLLFNIFEHCYVPEHIKLNEEEKQSLYKEKNIKDNSQLPEISMFDPVAKAMLMKPGDICKITRYDIISFNNVFYRICVI